MCIVTVSRGSFSGAKAVAEGLAERLSVPCVSREILVEAAGTAGLSTRGLTEALERAPSFFERASTERDTYMRFVRAALYRNATEGSFVYHGHDGHLLLDLPNVLRTRVVAPLEMRVDAVKASLDLSEKDAERHIAKIDGHRAKWTKYLYGVAWDDPLLYDAILNLEKMGVEGAIDLLADLARSGQFEWTDALRARASDQSLCAQVWSELAKVPETRITDLEIDAEGGVVVLRGNARSDELRRMVVEAAEKVSDAQEIRNEISIPSDVWRK